MHLLVCKLDFFSDHNRFSPHTLSSSLYHQPLRVSMLSHRFRRDRSPTCRLSTVAKSPATAHPYEAVSNRLGLKTSEGTVNPLGIIPAR
jgi:hypothetical protein